MLAEVSAVMEEELERLFGQKVPMEKIIYSGRSFPEDGHSIVGFLDDGAEGVCGRHALRHDAGPAVRQAHR